MNLSGNGEKGILLYGGSFNPLHIGHLRLAIEAAWKMRDLLDEVIFLPVSVPPHKNPHCLLPIEIRAEMIAGALHRLPRMRCDTLERQRPGPSYTIDTLRLYGSHYPPDRIFFLIGSQDFEMLPEWRHGLELIGLANFVVAPRGGFAWPDLLATCRKFWQGVGDAKDHVTHPSGHGIYFLPVRFLDISSSMIRAKWLAGENIDFLAPESVVAMLDKRKAFVKKYWGEEAC